MLTVLLSFGRHFREIFGDDNIDLNALQMTVRAIATFLIALILIRVAGLRSFGNKSAFDIVLSITVGAVLSRCITGHYSFLACVAASVMLALLHRFVPMLVLHNPGFGKIIKGIPDKIFSSGRIDWEKMKQHNISQDDLNQAIRKAGYLTTEEIFEAYFETDGKLSIIPKKEGQKNINDKSK